MGTISGIQQVPCDTSLRARLDAVSPESLRPVFKRIFGQLQRGNALEEMAFLAGHSLWCLEGTGYVSSQTIPCASCVHKVHRHGSITDDHHRLGAAIVHPDVRAVLPLLPEAIVKHEGTERNEGERHAAPRCIAKVRQDPPHLKGIVTEESLRANAPPLETRHEDGGHAILGVNEGDHALLFTHVPAAEHAGRVTDAERHDRATGLVQRFRCVHEMPRTASRAEVRVHVIEEGEIGEDKVPHVRWVTDLRVSQRHGYRRMRGGRARWKIEHETCNTLKHQGDHFEHHDGQGTHNLSVVCALRMRLAFVVDQTPQRCGALFRAVWATRGSKRLWWERMRALLYDDRLESMRELWEALLYGFEKSHPVVRIDTS